MELHLEIAKERIRRGGLWAFVREFWSTVESVELIEEPHMPLLCRAFEECSFRASRSFKPAWLPWMEGLNGDIPEVVVACPPGVSKSLTASVMWPAWWWSWCPQAKVISTSYSEQLAHRDAKRAFEVMTSEKYMKMYPHVEIQGGDRASMSFYTNSKRGMRFATAMGSAVTGFHANALLIDDFLKPQDLQGDAAAALEKVVDKYDTTFSSRSAHPATFTRVIIAQRLHYNDLSGVLIERGAHHVCLPMEYDPARKYSSHLGEDWRTEPGELLAPIRFPPEVVQARKSVLPTNEWAGQYNQQPSPADGSLFLREWFDHRYVGCPWGTTPLTVSIDSSHKDGKGSDYTVILVGAKVGPRYYVVDVLRARMGFTAQIQAVEQMRRKWANVRNILVEAKANGEAIIDTLRRTMSGVVSLYPQGGKESRAAATEYLWNSGCVMLPEKAAWLGQFIEEHIKFPVFTNDDCVDACTQWLMWASARDRNSVFKDAMANQREKMNRPWGRFT